MMIRILRALTRYIAAFYNLGFGSALKIVLHSTLLKKEVELKSFGIHMEKILYQDATLFKKKLL